MDLPGDYIAGFVDGEGCFALKLRRDVRHERKGTPAYIYWGVEFAIVLRKDDKEILEKIMAVLGCGRISINQQGSARYSVSKINELLTKIIPFFDNYRLYAKKRYDFELWKEAVKLLYKNKGKKTNIKSTGNPRGKRKMVWEPQELKKLEEIYEAMRPYKSKGGSLRWIDQAKPAN